MGVHIYGVAHDTGARQARARMCGGVGQSLCKERHHRQVQGHKKTAGVTGLRRGMAAKPPIARQVAGMLAA